MATTVSIKQLHARTGALVREAGKSRAPFVITDNGRPVAVLSQPQALKLKRRARSLLPEYAALLRAGTKGSVMDDLDAVRGER